MKRPGPLAQEVQAPMLHCTLAADAAASLGRQLGCLKHRAGSGMSAPGPQPRLRAICCLPRPACALIGQMPPPAYARLRAVGSTRLAGPRHCRSVGCLLEPQGPLGFCVACERVHFAARALRERLLARRGAQLRAAYPDLFDELDPELCEQLLAHVAAQSAHHGRHSTVFELAGLEDFFAELRDLESLH